MIDHSLRDLPQYLRRISTGLPPSVLAIRPRTDRFSLIEHTCHLRDIEVEGYEVRIRRILNEELPLLDDIDGSKLAAERNYRSEDFSDALDAFAACRDRNIAALARVSDADLQRRGRFGPFAVITLAQLVDRMREHDAAHREEIDALLAELAIDPARVS